MPSYVTPKKNAAFILYAALTAQSDVKTLQSAPTIVAGDVKVSVDGGAFANLTTLPTVVPGASVAVKVTLSAAEMNGDNIMVTFIDQAGAQWCDLAISIQTSVKQMDDLGTEVKQDTILGAVNSVITLLGSGLSLSTAEKIAIADQVLTRDWTSINPETVADRCALQALRFLRNAWAIADGTLTVSGDDDTGVAWGKPVTFEARNPVNSMGNDIG
jgi:hypothetical protein